MATLIRNLIISTCLLSSTLALADEPPAMMTSKGCYGVKDSDFSKYMEEDAKNYEFLANNTQVKDKRTGLTWQRCPLGTTFSDNSTPDDIKDDMCIGKKPSNPQMPVSNCKGAMATQMCLGEFATTFKDAQDKAKAVGDNWRLPNIKELASISMANCKINKNTYVFPSGFAYAQGGFVSSTAAIKDGKYEYVKVFQLTGSSIKDAKASDLSNQSQNRFVGIMLAKDQD